MHNTKSQGKVASPDRSTPTSGGWTPPPLDLSAEELLYLRTLLADIDSLNRGFDRQMPTIHGVIQAKVRKALIRA